jgi:DNA-binding NtrC family response regulator
MHPVQVSYLPSYPLRILHLEDEPDCTELLQWKLHGQGIACEFQRVDNRGDFIQALENGAFDLILSDYCLPTFDGSSALALAREKAPELPFIFVTGTFNEHTARQLLEAGATEYIIKPSFSKIAPAVLRAMREIALQRERKRAELRLASIQDNCLLMTSTLDLIDIIPDILRKVDALIEQVQSFRRNLRRRGVSMPAASRSRGKRRDS